jgi:hypothetical protein
MITFVRDTHDCWDYASEIRKSVTLEASIVKWFPAPEWQYTQNSNARRMEHIISKLCKTD